MKERVRITDQGIVVDIMNELGQEIPDSVPMAPPVGFKASEPLHMRIRAMVQHEYERARLAKEVETPEEADDFIIDGDDDSDPRESRFAVMPGYEWEDNYEPPADWKEMSNRLVAAGWTPPSQAQRTPPEGGAEPLPSDSTSGAQAAPGAASASVAPSK